MHVFLYSVLGWFFIQRPVLCTQWPVARVERFPIVELSLAAPPRPHPEVMSEIGKLSRAGEATVHAHMDKLELAFANGLEQAREKIGNAVVGAMSAMDDRAALATLLQSGGRLGKRRAQPTANVSFLQSNNPATRIDRKLGVKVKVYPSAPLDMAVKGYIDAVGREQMHLEETFFDQARAEIDTLIEFVTQEAVRKIDTQLDNLLHRAGEHINSRQVATFLEASQSEKDMPEQANVKVVAAAVPYPTVASLVQEMGTRQNLMENLERAKYFKLELEFLKAANKIFKLLLKEAINRVLAQVQ